MTGARRSRLDVHGGQLRVGEAKTEAAKLPVFPTRSGGMLNASNLRSRLLKETVKRVNGRREKEGRMLLPEKVTPHTLRRTFASLALAAGRDPRWVIGQLGTPMRA